MRKLPDLLTPAKLSKLKASASRVPADEKFLLGDTDRGVLVRVITPVLGGNVESFHPGEIDFVRVPSIRGAVRWWWRALHPELLTNELRVRERRVWGGVGRAADEPSHASPVRIDVSVTNRGRESAPGEYRLDERKKNKDGKPQVVLSWKSAERLKYALFPLQIPAEEREVEKASFPVLTKKWRDGLEFELRVRVVQRNSLVLSDDDQRDVLDAFRLWLTFGGYGARTRRGFGALHCDAVSYEDACRVLARVKGSAQKERKGSAQKDRPTLAECMLLEGPKKSTAGEAHGELLEALSDFRQGTSFGRDRGSGKPFGRSRWPEADSLRSLAKVTKAHQPDRSFKSASAPRAEFGLPIEVKFMREDEAANGMIASSKEKKGARWASPLLLRPVCRGKNEYVPVVLVLAGHRPEEAWVHYKRGKNDVMEKVPTVYNHKKEGGARDPVLDILSRNGGHALDAFAGWLVESENKDRRKYKLRKLEDV